MSLRMHALLYRQLPAWLSIVACVLVIVSSPGLIVADTTPAPSFAAPEFQQVWNRDDEPVASGNISRSWLWGPSPGVTRQEQFAGAPGGSRTVQYFDKSRMELNEAITDVKSQWRVTTGLLVTEMVS